MTSILQRKAVSTCTTHLTILTELKGYSAHYAISMQKDEISLIHLAEEEPFTKITLTQGCSDPGCGGHTQIYIEWD